MNLSSFLPDEDIQQIYQFESISWNEIFNTITQIIVWSNTYKICNAPHNWKIDSEKTLILITSENHKIHF